MKNTISPKVSAGVSAASLTAPLTGVVLWVLSLWKIPVTPEAAADIAIVLAALASGVTGYLVPHVEAKPPEAKPEAAP